MPNSDNPIDINEFEKVDKISDEVYSLGLNFSLRMNVSLSKVSNDKRYHFHKEYEYPSKVQGVDSLVTIKRSFDYYLSIEGSINKSGNLSDKIFIRIGPTEYYAIKKGLDQAIKWFTDSKYNKLYARNKGELIMMPPIPDYTIQSLPMNRYITIAPIVIDRGMANADKIPGVRMYFNENAYTELTVDRLMGFHYTFSSFNMYQAAIEMINYLGRPDFGFNRFTIGKQQVSKPNLFDLPPKSGGEGIQDRFVTPKNKKRSIEELE